MNKISINLFFKHNSFTFFSDSLLHGESIISQIQTFFPMQFVSIEIPILLIFLRRDI